MVRALNGVLPDDFARVRHLLSGPDKVAVVPQGKESIHGYAVLRDIERQPALMLRMDQPRDIYQRGQNTVKYFLVSLFVIAVLAALMMRLLIGKLLASTQKHREVEQRYRAVVQQSGEGIILVEVQEGRLVDANTAFCRLLGYHEEEIERLLLKDLLDGSAEAARQYLADVLTGSRQITSEAQYRRKDGSWIDVEVGAYGVTHGGKQVVCVMVRDITERKIAQSRIQYLANYDGLTNLPNRTLLMDRLRQELAHAERNHWLVATVILNLDRFKVINDSLGHYTGDLLLQAVGQRLEAAVRHGDTVSRQGGDEFVIVLSQVKDLDDVSGFSEKILHVVAQPYDIKGQEISITTAIGICLYPQDGMDADSLLKNADMAMYRAKALGGNDHQIYNIGMETGVRERLRLEVNLHHALERDELYLVYQPQVSLATGRVFGMEALVRWRNPELGEITPVKFIPLAEESGLILPIGEWVLRTACGQMRQWQLQGFRDLVVSVNLSARQLQQKGLVNRVAAALDAAGLPAAALDLELTESMLMNNIHGNISILNMLKEMGIALSIDDFGTGYSSLAYLHSLPIETLKIDRAFVRDIISRDGDAPIAKAVIVLAHSLGHKVIAEGVETDEQLGFLRAQGCDAIQGYYFSRPLSTGDFTALLRSGRCMPVPEMREWQVVRS